MDRHRQTERGFIDGIDRRQRTALKLGMVGLIVGTTGALLTAYFSETIGKVMFLVGSVLVFAGIFVTLVLTFHTEAGKREKGSKD